MRVTRLIEEVYQAKETSIEMNSKYMLCGIYVNAKWCIEFLLNTCRSLRGHKVVAFGVAIFKFGFCGIRPTSKCGLAWTKMGYKLAPLCHDKLFFDRVA